METPQRVLVVHPGPEFSVADVYAGWVEALTGLGLQVAEYNMNDRIVFYHSAFVATGKNNDEGMPEFKKALSRAQSIEMATQGLYGTCHQFWPQLILVVSGFFIDPTHYDRLRDRGHKVVLLHTESPYQDKEQLERAPHVDLNLLNDPLNLEAYRACGVPAEYMPHAYRPHIHNVGPVSAEFQSDFAFVGTGFPSRIEFFERMVAAGGFDGLDICLAGNWQRTSERSPLRKLLSHDIEDCVDNELAAKVYRGGKTGLNMYRRETEDDGDAGGLAMGPREVEMAACGLFFLRESRPESDEVFKGILPTFYGPEDAAEKLRWWLAHDDLREDSAALARQAIRPRTFDANARKLLQLAERL